MKPFVTANIVGPVDALPGIGNQLFQIAAVLSYSKDHGHTAIFPCLKEPSYGGYVNNFLSKLNTTHEILKDTLCVTEPSFAFTPLPYSPYNVCIVNSYLQSEKYFKHNRELIMEYFRLPEEDLKYLLDKYGNLDSTTSVHIRRGDYLDNPNYHTVLSDTTYYRDALDLLNPEKVLVFSDDLVWAKNNFPNFTVVEEDKDYLEIFLMAMCKDNIIANSTFSWWGAWLNENPNKRVIAPNNWFGSLCNLDVKDLLPSDWITL